MNGFEPLRIAPPTRVGLVAPLGRDALLDRLESLLFGEGVRILTLLGPPGIGKTTTSLALLSRVGPRLQSEGGAWFCDLTATTTESGLALAVTSLGGGRLGAEEPGAPAVPNVGELLATRGRTLLVLDNFEQIAFAAPAVERWCQQAEGLSLVVTSRERLGIPGEVVVEVPPLAMPADDVDERAILASPAVQLFLQRCRDAGVVAPLDAAVVARVVRRLEGLPLAIDLAAASLRVMTLEALEQRLSAGHAILSNAGRTRGRHATLSNAIESSWKLLSAQERVALARCSVFAGGFPLDLAETVIGEPDALASVAGLRDKSLLRADPSGRLAMYESVRELATQRLVELDGTTTRARDAQAHALGELARRFNTSRYMIAETPDARASETIRWERENLAAAVEHARVHGIDTSVRAHLAAAAGLLGAVPPERSVADLTECLERLEPSSVIDRSVVRLARHNILLSIGQIDAALADLRGLASDDAAPRALQLTATAHEGVLLRSTGRPREAWERHMAVAAALESVSAARIGAMNSACMGRLAFDLQDPKASEHYNREALAWADASGDTLLGALALANLAQMEQEGQRFERAATLMTGAMKRLRKIGDVYEATYCCATGHLYSEWGKLDDARRWYAEGTTALRASLRAHGSAALALAGWAVLEARSAETDRAAQLMAEARRSARTSRGGVVALALELHQASVDLWSAPPAARSEIASRVGERIARAGTAKDADAETLATSFEARFALRMTRQALATRPVDVAGVRIERAGAWFQVGDQRPVHLTRRASLQRILAALVGVHLEHRGRGMGQRELANVGWPGEQILADAAATRVRVAIATLRRLGLREHLVTSSDGYRLDPKLRVEVCA